MATYIIGDVQGCYTELLQLLEAIDYNPDRDQLGFVGDLVNRGPDSLSVLRFIKNLPNPLVVLGNHDFYLLAIGYGSVVYHGDHTLDPILEASDKLELLEWLRIQPLVIYLQAFDTVLVHAGFPPQWKLADLLLNADMACTHLRSNEYVGFLRDIEYHRHTPLQWREQADKKERIHYTINALTRMRFCNQDGTLDLSNKTARSTHFDFRPWFEWYQLPHRVMFGHWAALDGRKTNPNCEALDTGCVWGRSLTAYCLEDQRRISIQCKLPPLKKGD